MIEMRWLVRPGWDGPEKILQYRQYVDTTVYAHVHYIQDPGGYLFPPMAKMAWSQWKDVPTVENK